MIGYRTLLALAALAALPQCGGDETLTAYGAAGTQWQLQQLDGQPFAAPATLHFPKPGQIAGEAPCNSYFASQSLPYPWFRADAIGSTRRACPALEAEARYLQALSEMSLAEVAGDTLILSNESGREMVFHALR